MMMDLAKLGKIDLILTKSISRFARNVIDCLESIRSLKQVGCEVYFETDNISSFDSKIEFVISILAGIAEEEARSVSENVKWNIQRKFSEGKASVVTKRLLGYDTDDSGNLVINSYQAEIVRLIYRMYIFGSSVKEIVHELETRGIQTLTGNVSWSKSSIHYILKNYIYTGGMVLQSTYRPDFHSKHKRLNKGEKTKYEVENSHPGIITKADYDYVQQMLQEKNSKPKDNHSVQTVSSKYTGKFRCGICGKNYRMKWNNRHSNHPTQILMCSNNVDKKTCNNESIFTEVADEVIALMIKQIKQRPTKFYQAFEEHYKLNKAYQADKLEHPLLLTKISNCKLEIDKLKSTNDYIAKALLVEYNGTLQKLESSRVAIENRFHTTHNIEHKLDGLRLALRNEFTSFEDLFDHIEIQDREHWWFCFDDSKAKTENNTIALEGTYTYFIRKTSKTIHFGIQI